MATKKTIQEKILEKKERLKKLENDIKKLQEQQKIEEEQKRKYYVTQFGEIVYSFIEESYNRNACDGDLELLVNILKEVADKTTLNQESEEVRQFLDDSENMDQPF